MHTIVGLGNPGEEYEETRHNVGRMLVEFFGMVYDFDTWKETKKAKALVAEGKIGKEKVLLILPNTFMNKSGAAVSPFVKTKKAAERLVVVYDDIDLPLGALKISFGRGSGGHRGLESVMRSLKTRDFVRVRVGVASTTPGGKLKKPKGEEAVVDFLMKGFKKSEQDTFKKIKKRVAKALEAVVLEGRVAAMNEFNSL